MLFRSKRGHDKNVEFGIEKCRVQSESVGEFNSKCEFVNTVKHGGGDTGGELMRWDVNGKG